MKVEMKIVEDDKIVVHVTDSTREELCVITISKDRRGHTVVSANNGVEKFRDGRVEYGDISVVLVQTSTRKDASCVGHGRDDVCDDCT